MRDSTPTTDALVNEFMTLNRRRLFGSPPLGVDDLDRWQDLRQTLEQRLGDRMDGLLAIVERRAHFRFPTHLEVRFEDDDGQRSACLENLSEGGMFLAAERPLAAGTPLKLSIPLPAGTLRIRGRVAWIRSIQSRTGPAGMGIRFEDPSDAQREQIAGVVAWISHEEGNA
ncbi:MAG: TIGR02266 family protein [Myxococcales bacterium]|nr:TIGR02266 family protein [Myxococcales bacterium]